MAMKVKLKWINKIPEMNLDALNINKYYKLSDTKVAHIYKYATVEGFGFHFDCSITDPELIIHPRNSIGSTIRYPYSSVYINNDILYNLINEQFSLLKDTGTLILPLL